MAIILSKELKVIIHLVPRIIDISNSGLSTRTPDYKINNMKWDLKTPKFKKKYNNLLNDIFRDTSLKKQSERFVIDLKIILIYKILK